MLRTGEPAARAVLRLPLERRRVHRTRHDRHSANERHVRAARAGCSRLGILTGTAPVSTMRNHGLEVAAYQRDAVGCRAHRTAHAPCHNAEEGHLGSRRPDRRCGKYAGFRVLFARCGLRCQVGWCRSMRMRIPQTCLNPGRRAGTSPSGAFLRHRRRRRLRRRCGTAGLV